MNAHWRDGRDIEDREVLGELAAQAGLDPADALAFLDSEEVGPILDAQRQEAMRWGVTGIPTRSSGTPQLLEFSSGAVCKLPELQIYFTSSSWSYLFSVYRFYYSAI